MPNPSVDLLIFLADQAYSGHDEHVLLVNIRDLRPEDWSWLPPGGHRSIRRIVEHAAIAKHLYTDHLAGGARTTYASLMPESPLARDPDAIPDLLRWLDDGHRAFIDALRTLQDDDLIIERRTHWGKTAETRWIVNVLIQHDLYHAGEINHLRALAQDADRWWPQFQVPR